MSERNQRLPVGQAESVWGPADSNRDSVLAPPQINDFVSAIVPVTGQLGNSRGSSHPLALLLLTALILVCGLFLWYQGVFKGFVEAQDLSAANQSRTTVRLPIARESGRGAGKSEPLAAPASAPDPQGVAPSVNRIENPVSYGVLVGPILSSKQLKEAVETLESLGFSAEPRSGSGSVSMVRLLEGIYPSKLARVRLAEFEEMTDSAFLMPVEGGMALYLGSFSDPQRASLQQRSFAAQGINVTQVVSEVRMDGKLLLALRADLQTAQQAEARINQSGYRSQIIPIEQDSH